MQRFLSDRTVWVVLMCLGILLIDIVRWRRGKLRARAMLGMALAVSGIVVLLLTSRTPSTPFAGQLLAWAFAALGTGLRFISVPKVDA